MWKSFCVSDYSCINAKSALKGGRMNSFEIKIVAVNQKLSEFTGNSGVICFELNQCIEIAWKNAFFSYLCVYRPSVFSMYRPEILEGKYIKAHAEIDGQWGIENVLATLKSMVAYANSKCPKQQTLGNTAFHLPISGINDLRSFGDKLSILNFE